MGKIVIEGMQFYAYHGRYQEEQVVGNQFLVDVYIETDISEAAGSDNLEFTINYEEIYSIAKTEMKERSHLLEHVGKRILDKITEKYGKLTTLRVRISKLHPPVRGNVRRVYVELEQS